MARLLSGPGGSTKGAGIGPALCEAVRQGFDFDYYVGVSYSSIIAVLMALGMHKDVEEQSIKVTHNKVFDVAPMTKKGKISPAAVMRMIGSIFAPKKFNSLGLQNVQKLLKQFVTKELFEQYQNGDYPIVYICAVGVGDQMPTLWNIKEKEFVSYETYLDMVSASSRIPVWTQPQAVTYKGETKLYYDGGMTDTNAGSLVLDLHSDITEVVSIYPGPIPLAASNADEVKGVIGAIEWTIDTMLRDIIRNDIINEKDVCGDKGIALKQILLPDVLKNLYDTDPKRLQQLKEESIAEVQKYFK